jgi:hypothetical protein
MTSICWLNVLIMCTVSPDGDFTLQRQVAHIIEKGHELIFQSLVAMHSNPLKLSHITIAHHPDQELHNTVVIPL